ncbi:MAG: hypothetical protein ACRD9R_06105 [Pyrinomonadaceae bacterium]
MSRRQGRDNQYTGSMSTTRRHETDLGRGGKVYFFFLLVALLLTGGCSRAGSDTNDNAAPPRQLTEFERDLAYVRKGQFVRVLVFKRKDGEPFAAEDKKYLKENSPEQTNMWLSTEGDRRIIAGTNFAFEPKHLEALLKRFDIEDFTGQ